MQAPRSLWDANYVTYDDVNFLNGEKSYISQYFNSYLPLIPKIQQSVSTFYPDTKIAFNEYNYGGGNEITGGITQADVLGIFGKYGIFYANYWDTYGETSYISPAFQLFTNYDGTGKMFGNTSVTASTNKVSEGSVYASIDNNDDKTLHIIALNKQNTNQMATFNITAASNYSLSQVYQLDGNSASISRKTDYNFRGNNFNYMLPALSVIHFVISSATLANEKFDDTNANIQLYPNPTKGILNIKSSQNIEEILILDLFGKSIVSYNQTTSESINLSSLPTGIYIVKVKINGKYYTEKITKL